jgi:hypothetical protein
VLQVSEIGGERHEVPLRVLRRAEQKLSCDQDVFRFREIYYH